MLNIILIGLAFACILTMYFEYLKANAATDDDDFTLPQSDDNDGGGDPIEPPLVSDGIWNYADKPGKVDRSKLVYPEHETTDCFVNEYGFMTNVNGGHIHF